jgi:AcrR family transcriptional regulator
LHRLLLLLLVNNSTATYTRHVKEGARSRTRAEQNATSGRRLLQALIELTAAQGYEATTAAAIGVRAGYSRAMVHARCGTKDALLDELMRTEYEERIVPAPDEAATGLDRVLAHVDRLAALATEDERFLKAMFVLSFEAVRGSPALTTRITAWMTGLEKGIAEALDKGKDDRSVRADLNTSTAARDIVITGVGIAYAWIVLPGTNLHAELARWRSRIINDCARMPRTRRGMRP